jgi:hypothetical protein
MFTNGERLRRIFSSLVLFVFIRQIRGSKLNGTAMAIQRSTTIHEQWNFFNHE